MAQPLISICIPAYKKPQYVVRLLHSIIQQSYKRVEIIISDDSPGEDIKEAIAPFNNQLTIYYYHNQPALKSPRNWNAGLDKANGDLVVLMHQDDWYHTPDALVQYVTAFDQNPEADFVFCRNTAVDETGKETILQARPELLKTMKQHPNRLVLAQVIGPPSNTMLRKTVKVRYDEAFIWLVDVDYYARVLQSGHNYVYLDKHLVSIGLHEDQTTVFCRTNNDIIFKENIWFAGKMGDAAFKDILIFDYYWRLLRNYNIRSLTDFEANGVLPSQIPNVIKHILSAQQKLAPAALKKGIYSKAQMAKCYIGWRLKK